MAKTHLFIISFLGLFSISPFSCAVDYLPSIVDVLLSDKVPATQSPTQPQIQNVYIAQTHVHQVDDDYFSLTGNRDALLKVQVVAGQQQAAPPVTVTLELEGETTTLNLLGPEILPPQFNASLGAVQHKFDDSFTATIPARWMKSGLKLRIDAGQQTKFIDDFEVGAPTALSLTMLDIHFFRQINTGDYPDGWQQELASKWPISQLSVERVPNIVLNELVIPPRAGIGPVKVDSLQSYFEQTGLKFDGEQLAIGQLNRALQTAAGRAGRTRLYYANIYGVKAGGQAGNFAGVGGARSVNLLHHELGHALSLPHWGNSARYPYKGDMFGIRAPNSFRQTHAGPIWAYDQVTRTFIPPTRQPNSINPNQDLGAYKKDPMQGGGSGDQEEGFLMRHFSDFSLQQMRNYLERHIVVWNPELLTFASWDNVSSTYSKAVSNNDFQFPVKRDVDVISVLASISASAPEVNMVYPAIGPYKADLIRLLDPRVAQDRQAGQSAFCPALGCDISVRVMQANEVKIYMLPAAWEPGVHVRNRRALLAAAINLPASDGEVSNIDLLLTPDAQVNGLPIQPQVLDNWQR